MLYLAGLGVGKLVTDKVVASGLSQNDTKIIAAFFVMSLLGSILVIFLEGDGQQPTEGHNEANCNEDKDEELSLDPKPITEANFFQNRHLSVRDYTALALAENSDDPAIKHIA